MEQSVGSTVPSKLPAGAADFDFLIGDWRVEHRRLADRLSGSTDWVEFEGTTRVRPILGGLGNFDENQIGLPNEPYEACTLRLFDPAARHWSIHWIDGRNPVLDPPLRGTFADGVGTFFGEDRHEGRPIHVRFFWTVESPECARWEQAFSDDGQQTWETNWTMVFRR